MSKKADSDDARSQALMKELAGHDAETASLLGDLGTGLAPHEDPLFVDLAKREPARPAGPPEPVTYVEPRVPPAPSAVKTFEMETVKRTDTVRDLAIMKRDTLRGLNSGAPGAEEGPPSSGPSPVVVPSVNAEAGAEAEAEAERDVAHGSEKAEPLDARKVPTQRKLRSPPRVAAPPLHAPVRRPDAGRRKPWFAVAVVLVLIGGVITMILRNTGVNETERSTATAQPSTPAYTPATIHTEVVPSTLTPTSKSSVAIPTSPASLAVSASSVKPLPKASVPAPIVSTSSPAPAGPDPKRQVPF